MNLHFNPDELNGVPVEKLIMWKEIITEINQQIYGNTNKEYEYEGDQVKVNTGKDSEQLYLALKNELNKVTK